MHHDDHLNDLEQEHDVSSADGKKAPVLDLNKPPNFITVEELADMLLLNVKTVYAAIQAGKSLGLSGCVGAFGSTIRP